MGQGGAVPKRAGPRRRGSAPGAARYLCWLVEVGGVRTRKGEGGRIRRLVWESSQDWSLLVLGIEPEKEGNAS